MSAHRARAKPIDEPSPRQLAAIARACLILDTASERGLLSAGLEIDVEQCEAVLERLAADGVEPTEDEVLAVALSLCHEIGVLR